MAVRASGDILIEASPEAVLDALARLNAQTDKRAEKDG
jgi:hypothetical protein